MKIIYNKYIPFSGFKAMNLFGILFVRKGATIDEKTLNHERIHTAQMRELLFVLFYVFYLFEYIVRLFQYRFDSDKAYRNISFEREAYANERYLIYLDERKFFAFLKYL